MKRPSYRAAVAWLAANDNAATLDLAAIELSIATTLVADLFGRDAVVVALDVQRVREAAL